MTGESSYPSSRASRPGRFSSFPTTHWSLVDQAAAELSADQQEALNALLTEYWPLLRSRLVNGRGIEGNQADDLVQNFIHDQVLRGKLLKVAEPSRGKFRNLLCKALNNYVAKHIRAAATQKRQVNRAVSLDRENGANLAVSSATPGQNFDGVWARETLAVVLEEMQQDLQANARDNVWAVFEGRILAPILHGVSPVPYDELVREHGFSTTAQAQNALITAKRTFCRLMRQVLLNSGTAPSDVDLEVKELQQCLAAY